MSSMFHYQKIKQSFPVKVYVKTFKITSFGVSEGGNENLFFKKNVDSIFYLPNLSIFYLPFFVVAGSII